LGHFSTLVNTISFKQIHPLKTLKIRLFALFFVGPLQHKNEYGFV
jgi:hypothetical protein